LSVAPAQSFSFHASMEVSSQFRSCAQLMEITSIGPSYLRLLSPLIKREEAARRGEY
jgi:hypothetical protein